MRIDYVSSAMDALDFAVLFQNSPQTPGQQAQKYNRLMMQGLAENGASVRAVTARPVTDVNCIQKYLPAKNIQHEKVKYHYGSVLNIKGVKNFWQMAMSFFNVLFGGCDAVVTDVLNASVAYGAVTAARVRKKNCIGIVTDLPELMVTGTNPNHAKLVRKIMKKCTGYVFLTEAMNGSENPEHKPYVIVEALCDFKIQTSVREKREASAIKKCMYAGLLDARYGVKDMVDGFVLAAMPGVELHVYGSGSYVDELQKIAHEHPNVIYHGIAMNDEVVQAEMEADILINPRPTYEEFTKYSFPSKNIEYMASGTPVLTTNLPGMPEGYKSYVYLIEDETVEGMAQTFKSVMGLDDTIREKKGMDAQKYVLECKNNVSQSEKVLQLIESIHI